MSLIRIQVSMSLIFSYSFPLPPITSYISIVVVYEFTHHFSLILIFCAFRYRITISVKTYIKLAKPNKNLKVIYTNVFTPYILIELCASKCQITSKYYFLNVKSHQNTV